MVCFDTVLDGVRRTLTQASPAQIKVLLEGLVEEQIISEAYGERLGLLRHAEGTAADHQPPECTSQTHGSKVRTKSEESHNQTGSPEEGYSTIPQIQQCVNHENTRNLTGMNHVLSRGEITDLKDRLVCTQICDHQSGVGLNAETKKLLRSATSMQGPISDNERKDEGNLESEREWLEEVEEAARRIAVPLWQQWDRGRKMLLSLVPGLTRHSPAVHSGTQSNVLDMKEETEVAAASRTLDFTGTNFLLDTDEAAVSLGNLSGGFDDLDCFSVSGEMKAAPSIVIEDFTTDSNNNNNTEAVKGDEDVFWATNTTVETGSCTETGLADHFAHFISSFAPKDNQAKQQEIVPVPDVHHCMNVDDIGVGENALQTAFSTYELVDCHDKQEHVELTSWGTKMQEVDQDPNNCPDLGDLPDDFDDLLYNDDILGKLVDDVLFGDPWFNCEDDIEDVDDFSVLTDLLNSDIQPLSKGDTLTRKTTDRRKRPKVPHSKESTDENALSRAKRPRGADQGKHIEVQTEPAVIQDGDASDLTPVGFVSTPPPNILPVPQVQFVTFADSPRYQVVRSLQLSPSVIRLPLPTTATTPHLIFVPAPSPASKCQLPPLSPVGGVVAPVQMSSSPPGSLSDTATNTMSPPYCVSPRSPISERSPFKESPVPQSPTCLDIPQTVKDYIQDMKAHMSQTCEDMEAGLSLTSHYVDVQVIQREIPRSGKNTSKCMEKELVIMGDTDRKTNMVGMNQIFESSKGNKSKRYILLLGSMGMGKTTRIRRLCLDWSRDCIPQFDFVFLLNAKALTLTKPVHSLQSLLLSLSSLAPSCTDPEAVFAQILTAPKRVLLIFDAFEELREYEILLQSQEKDLITSLQKDIKAQSYTVRQLYSAILQRVLLPECTLLVSTRPRGNVGPLLRRADSLLDVCGFSPSDVETYLSKYFTDPDLKVSALNCLKSSSYLNLLCWNPGLCRLVCLVLEHSQNSEVLPRTLTGLCHQVLKLKMEAERRRKDSESKDEIQRSKQSGEETHTQISTDTQLKKCQSRMTVRTRSWARGAGGDDRDKDDGEVEEVQSCEVGGVDRTEKELLSQLSSLAWEGFKGNSSMVSPEQTVSTKLKEFGLRTGLLLHNPLGMKQPVACEGEKGNKPEDQKRTKKGEKDCTADPEDQVLLWASSFLQSFLAGVHVSLSRMVADRPFLQTLPFNTGSRGRRRPQREGLQLTQRFAAGLLSHDRTELQQFHLNTNTAFRDMLATKQNQVTKHFEGLSLSDLSPAQTLEACHYIYEGCFTNSEGGRDSRLALHLAENLPELLTFRGVPLSPPDVFMVRNILQQGGSKGRCFCLDLRESGIQVSGIGSLMELTNINTYRACIADVIALWEQLEQNGEEELLRGAVSKFKIHPLKATQVSHIEDLAKLVDIHTHRRLSDSASQSGSVLADGVPAVKELRKLEFEFGPENGRLALPKLWELLPGLHSLQHLDLENSKIGDDGAEKLADALVPLCSLEILNLSQNCIGERGVKKLAATLMHLPKLHCLSLSSNVISDEGAESLAAALPHMASLTDLDVTYNKLTDIGAQSLGTSLRHCKQIKSLRMWNQWIPGGVFERLQQQDHRILWH